MIIALLGMLAIGLSFISGLGIGAAAVVALTVAAAVTLLPAVLGFVGTNIDKLRLPWVHNEGDGTRETVWHRWSRFVQRRPWVLTIAGLAIVIALAAPVLSLRLGFVDAGNDPAGTQTRQAYDLLADGFGPGFNGPFLLAIQMPPGDNHAAELTRLHDAIAATPGVATVAPAVTNPAGTTAVIRMYPTTAPQDKATSSLLHQLRNDVIPQATAGTGVKVYVGGFNALTDDFANLLGQRLPLFIAVVIILSFLLLMTVFRSILVPLKAAIMNLLSIGAAYGVIVMIFQYGWGKGARRRRQGRPDPGLLADHDVRDPLRALDGLRGVPALAHPRGVPADGRQRARSPTACRRRRASSPPRPRSCARSSCRSCSATTSSSSCSASASRARSSSTPRSSGW